MQPIVYTHQLTVSAADLDELNHVNNQVYLRFLQEAAIAHWHALAPAEVVESLRWVVRRHEIDYLKPAFEHDTLEVKTWIEAFEGVTSVRHYEIYRGDTCLLQARTVWIALSAKTLRPQRLPANLSHYFYQ